ncbi:hypothetical protein [Actinophytocola sediminis]
MNEHEFRTALRGDMSVTPEPPPMGDGPVLDAAHRDRRRRRATWAGAGSAMAVAAIVVGVVAFTPGTGGTDGLEVAQSPSIQVTETPPPTENTNTRWPDGQTDQRVDSGPENDKAVALLDDLVRVVPAGYEVPEDLVGEGDLDGVRLKRHMAQYELGGPDDGKAWSYYADVPLAKGGGVGRLEIRVHEHIPGLKVSEGCELGGLPSCEEKLVDGKRVATFDLFDHPDGGTSELVGYRGEHATVFITQATTFEYAGLPAVDALPFTTDQLAELVTDARFQVH